MTKIVSVSVLAAVMALSFSSLSQAEERRDRDRDRDGDRRDRREVRQICSIVKKCFRDDGRYRCHRERVCRFVRR